MKDMTKPRPTPKTSKSADKIGAVKKQPVAIKKQLYQLVKREAQRRSEVNRTPKESYLYLYDNYLKERPFQPIISIIETRLGDFEIVGKIVRLSTFTNPRVLVEDEMRHGVKNVVIVGNDDTLARILTRAADLEVTFGFLPIGQKKNYLAKILGIPLNEKSVEVLAARKVEKIDFGIINRNRFFLSYLYIPGARVKIACDRSFTVSPGRDKFEIAVANLLPPPFESDKFVLQPQDGQMEVYFQPAERGLLSKLVKGKGDKITSMFPFQHLLITSDKVITVLADGKETQEAAVEIEVAKKKLKMVVGKGRQF